LKLEPILESNSSKSRIGRTGVRGDFERPSELLPGERKVTLAIIEIPECNPQIDRPGMIAKAGLEHAHGSPPGLNVVLPRESTSVGEGTLETLGLLLYLMFEFFYLRGGCSRGRLPELGVASFKPLDGRSQEND
jgi:hypothetical protein